MEGIQRLFKLLHVCTGVYIWHWKGSNPAPCPLYEIETRQCEAVTNHRLEETFSKGGCRIVLEELLCRATDKIARMNPDGVQLLRVIPQAARGSSFV